jgi:endonuclease/exonuclease/phosphatase family metal-dependent hydrolase
MKTMGKQETSDHCALRTIRPAVNRPLRCAAGLLLTLLLVASVAMAPSAPLGVGGKRGVDTMNANLYVGGGIGRVIALDPTDPAYVSNLVYTVTGVFYEIVASQPELRLQGVADRIAARMPDLVAVQEASLIRHQSPGDLIVGGTTPATNVVYNYLEILLDALKARGAHYAVASSTEEVDVEMPMFNLQTYTVDDVRLTDRDAILVRTDLPPGQLRVSNPQGGHFTYMIELPTVSVPRGWCSVDVFVRGERFRYICAHLEEETVPQLQMLQAIELIDGPANVCLPVIISGDFNADPLHRNGVETYDAFVAAGFDDAWAELHNANLAGGLTWGHDEFLADPSVPMIWRLDVVWYRGCGLLPIESKVLDLALDRESPPLWASDHAAVTADFRVHDLRSPKPAPHWAKFRSHFCR